MSTTSPEPWDWPPPPRSRLRAVLAVRVETAGPPPLPRMPPPLPRAWQRSQTVQPKYRRTRKPSVAVEIGKGIIAVPVAALMLGALWLLAVILGA